MVQKTYTIILLLSLICFKAYSYDLAIPNSDGKTIYYDWLNDKTELSVSSGESKYSGEIVIPESVSYNNKSYPITQIGRSAFGGCSELTSLIIGNKVTSIEDEAFWGCSSLTSLTIGSNVNLIGVYAFRECSGLTSLNIPNSVTNIKGGAFQFCTNLASVTLGTGVVTMGEAVFGFCSGLTSVEYHCKEIGNWFSGGQESIKEVVIGNEVTSIGDAAFSGCSGMNSITIGNNVTSIGAIAFSGCSSLTSITLPSSVNTIGYRLFEKCSKLSSIIIPNGVTSIDYKTFSGCSSLITVTIGTGVTSIGDDAFSKCDALSSIYLHCTVPPTIRSIDHPFYDEIYKNATLYVPTGTRELYRQAEGWLSFYNISEFNSTGVEEAIGVNDREIGRYTLDGKSISTKHRGINIVKTREGKVKKQLVK